MNIHLFGGSNSTGQLFINLIKVNYPLTKIIVFTRDKDDNFVDLDDPSSYQPNSNEDYVLVSFAPVWKISNFLKYLYYSDLSKFEKIKGIIICSSSSQLTKRFSYNNFDKELSSKLKNSEEEIFKIFEKSSVPNCIIQPTLIYGNIGKFKDKNMNLIITVIRKLPFIVLPCSSGKRQPIHAHQLAQLFSLKYDSIIKGEFKGRERLIVGGDSIISYENMIRKLQNSLSKYDNGRNCKIITINKRLFVFLIAPLNLISPKIFESLLRISSDLSGFNRVSELTNKKQLEFPIEDKDLFM